MKQPFYQIPIYWIERHRLNPMRLFFGTHYLSNDVKKWSKQFDFDTTDIKFTTKL